MKSEKGVTLTSLIIYVIAMSIVVATIATITNYFYGNINKLTERTSGLKEYTSFNSYFVNEINTKGNEVILVEPSESNGTKIVFSDANQFTYLNNSIYFNKVKICSKVTSCRFTYDSKENSITVDMQIAGKTFNNVYTLQKDI